MIKQVLQSGTFGFLLMIPAFYGTAQVPMNPDSVTMNPGYTQEVYYQFSNGNRVSVFRNTWDIAFRTMKMSSSILINDGSNVVLWTYPLADTSGWASLDTTGISSWNPIFNNPDDWENGAFSRAALGHPDYGWGIYNIATHMITGDSLFVIKVTDNTYKKLWIVKKDAPANIYYFRYANTDGSDPQELNLDCNPWTGKDFIGFNMQTNLPVDYQPSLESWDIVFTKYMSVQPDGTPYPVTGVLSNPGIYVKKFYPVDPEFNEWWPAPWDSTRSAIGWNWKYFDMTNFVYVVHDSMVFYVRDLTGDTYRLKFTDFAGTATGNIEFGKARVSSAGFLDPDHSEFTVSLYPNPATETISVEINASGKQNRSYMISLMDMAGRLIRSGSLPAGQTVFSWNIHALTPGGYLLVVGSGNYHSTYHFLKR